MFLYVLLISSLCLSANLISASIAHPVAEVEHQRDAKSANRYACLTTAPNIMSSSRSKPCIMKSTTSSPPLSERLALEHAQAVAQALQLLVYLAVFEKGRKYLTLGQAFKFYCFQPESIRNEIAKAFSSLYANDHEKPIRISPRRLRLAYDHIKDFRNICAHDERFYCAKTSPSRDIAVTDVVNDMQLVLSKNTYVELLAQYAAMLLKLSNSLGPDVLKKVLKEMKVESIYGAFSVNE